MADEVGARVREIRERLQSEAAAVTDRGGLEALRQRFFARTHGAISLALKDLGRIPAGERAEAGRLVNQLKREAEEVLSALARAVEADEAESQAGASAADLTLPGRRPARGGPHPLSVVRTELLEVFLELGYALADGPEVDDDFHNFEALNVPKDHPSRDMQDTLYLAPELVLRTHTSNVQIHSMESGKPPIRVISMGRCYRRDTADATHSPQFHQIEGLVVDEGIDMSHLKGTLEHLSRRVFGSTEVRLRPSYFPFTEPSAELDISCFACARRGCSLCKGSGYIELGGCGMVDPNVFGQVGIDPERYSGFAFGFGIERAAMLKHGIDSIRLFYENDLRFLRQFPAPV